jgi:hypothetical protein
MWLVACIGFLFFSLIELGIVMQAVTLLDRDEKKKKKKKAKYSITNAIFNRGKDSKAVNQVQAALVICGFAIRGFIFESKNLLSTGFPSIIHRFSYGLLQINLP